MKSGIRFVPYTAIDPSDIQQLFQSSFADAEGQKEGQLIARLVGEMMAASPAQDITGFVACKQEQTVGGIFFTRMRFEAPIEAFILSPVAVESAHQRQGTGQALIKHGIEHLRQEGVELLFTYGDPKYYAQVGFIPISSDHIPAPWPLTQPEGWLCQSLTGDEIPAITGPVRCVDALNRVEYW